MRVLICGDRNWVDHRLIERTVLDVHFAKNIENGQITHIISGECRGADMIAKTVASQLWFKYIGFPALWGQHGKAAGPIRNQQMLDEGKPDLVLAFHDDIERSKGTKDMVSRARKAGIKVEVITHVQQS